MDKTFVLYTGVLLLCYVIAKHAEKKAYKKWNIEIVSIILLLTALGGLRSSSVGNDSYAYAVQFELGEAAVINFEIGFKFLMGFSRLFGKTYTIFFLICSLITVWLIVARLWHFRQIAPFRYTVILFYCLLYFYTLSGIRQWLAVAICFYATFFLWEKNKPMKFIFCVMIAILIHTSAIVSLVMLLPRVLENADGNKKMRILKPLFFTVAPIFSIIILMVLIKHYGSFLTEFKVEKLDIGLMLPFKIIMLFFILVNGRKSASKKVGEKSVVSFYTLIFFEVLTLMTSTIGYFWNNVARIGWYFSIFTPVFYAYILSKEYKRNATNSIVKLMVMVITIYSYISTLGSYSTKIVPYYFFWEK